MSAEPHDEVEAARNGLGSFPRTIPEDSVEYFIYIIDTKVSDTQRRDKLRQIQTASVALIRKYLKDYIWEQDVFNLSLSRQQGVSHLAGRSFYGDSIEDEWIIVWLMVELSKQFDDAWVRVADTDGEFLLIEAANALPKWLNPEIADNRVWINKGHVRIIPRSSGPNSSVNQSGSITLDQALKYLNIEPPVLLTDSKIEKEAFFRLQKYPQGIADALHHSLIKIPRKVAYVLQKKASYISPAVEAFYLRDPIALKPLLAIHMDNLIFPPTDLVTCRIKFTKIGFAKLRSQEFPYPPFWPSSELVQESGDKDLAFRAEMGMKLTCGFEMLILDAQNQDKRIVREIKLVLEDLDAGEDKLPTNEEIKALGTTEDNDSWLDIDYQDFEKELAGKSYSETKDGGFGSSDTQDKLKKMVSRFEDLLTEDDAGDGIDDMDEDNDSDAEILDSDDESHNSAEEDFNEMMREMLGMSKETMDEMMGKIKNEMGQKGKGKAPAVIEEDSDEEIRNLSAAMEAELRASGALKLDDKGKNRALKSSQIATNVDNPESSDEEYLDEDYNLAKNMLESFKSQAGASGPAGNLMSMLGVQMPRDEHDSD